MLFVFNSDETHLEYRCLSLSEVADHERARYRNDWASHLHRDIHNDLSRRMEVLITLEPSEQSSHHRLLYSL